ncbi:serine/threonine protein kinase [Myxococcus stipitatus]|uniref:serine/threonine-protein kinase n=1 Tax=Myxococcus stipitatus TaxID=83455 RepID=UPI003145052F
MRDDGPPAVLCPGDMVVGYRVGAQLGRGGFGTVYRATCEGQPAALKLLHLPRVMGRVEREVSILLRLRHPNVVGIRAFGYWPPASPEFAVIAMEYVEGRQLDEWAREENPSARQVLGAVLGVARALAATHEAGVVHRDVKEANVMVRASDGLAVLVDYGVGDYEGAPGVTLSILPPGTPEYRPPEAWLFLEEHSGVRGARYVPGPSDDLWALGVVLYRLLTARVPFEAEDDQAFIQAVISGAPVAPRAANGRVPQALSEVCLRLLEKEARARFPDAKAVCEALEVALASADADWEVPLCDAYGPATATTEGAVDPMVRWMNEPLHRPRRGRRPEPAVEVEVPGADEAPPLDDATPAGRRKGWRALGLGLLGLATALVLLWGGGRGDEHRPVHEEVALAAKKPQAARAAAPTGPEAIPAAAARPATNPEVTATVTTTKSDTPPTRVPARKSSKGVRTALATTALCGALACTGPQVRSPPEPEPCPEGSAEGMKKLGMDIGEYNDGTLLLDEPSRFLMVTEGPARVTLGAQGATLTGRFIVGDRLYGRLTRARMGKGSVPVCLEVLDSSGNRGLEISGGGGDSGKVRVFSAFLVKAVSEFE